MERKTMRLGRWSQRVLPFFAAMGLTVIGGCGSDDAVNRKDADPDAIGVSRPDGITLDAQLKTDTLPPIIDVRPSDDSPKSDVGSIDGPSGIDVPRGPDLSAERPNVLDGAESDVPMGDPDANPGYGGQGAGGAAGGAGGSTVVGGAGGSTSSGGMGGSTVIVGTGGVPATGGIDGGSAGARIIGWPEYSATAPYVFPVTCNGAAQAAPAGYSFTLTNTGSTATTFTGVSFSGATGYTVNLTAGTSQIGPGESKVVTITPPAIPFTISPPATISSVLTLTTDEPTDNLHTIFLAEEIHGARLAWGPGAVSGYLGGAAPPEGTLTREFTVTNSGNQPTTAELVSSYPSFTIPTPTTVTIPAGSSVTRSVTFKAPVENGSYSTTIGLAPPVANNLCAPVPNPWTLQAISMAGYPQFTPTSQPISFSAYCGETPDSNSITIKNVGTSTLPWLPALKNNNGCFTITTPALPETGNLQLAAGESAKIELQPKKLGGEDATGCSADLTVTATTAGGDKTNTYPLSIIPLGARISVLSSENQDFGTHNITSPPTTVAPRKELTFQNLGFVDTANTIPKDTTVTLTLTISAKNNHLPGDEPPFIFPAQHGQPAGLVTMVTLEASNDGQIKNEKTVSVDYQRPVFGPSSEGTDSYQVTWTMSDHSCGSTSGTAAYLTGAVTAGSVIFGFTDQNSRSGDFGAAYCGSKASDRVYSVTNSGTGPLKITKAQLSTGSFHFDPTPSLPIEVAAGASRTFTIVPKTIDPASITPADLTAGSTNFATTLSIETDAPLSGYPGTPATDTMILTMQATGIYMDSIAPTTWDFPPVTWPGNTDGSNLTVNAVNHGNVPAVATLEAPSLFKLTGDTTVAANGKESLLYASFGPFKRCDVDAFSTSPTGKLSFAVAGRSDGVCHGASTDVTLKGTVNKTGDMCKDGLECKSDSGECRCTDGSCSNFGCCSAYDAGGVCVHFANQSAKLDPPVYPGCGKGGAVCVACGQGLSCVGGVCQAPQ